MDVAVTDAQMRATNKYRKKYEFLQTRVEIQEKEEISAHIELTGESLNAFVRRAISETMTRDKKAINSSDE